MQTILLVHQIEVFHASAMSAADAGTDMLHGMQAVTPDVRLLGLRHHHWAILAAALLVSPVLLMGNFRRVWQPCDGRPQVCRGPPVLLLLSSQAAAVLQTCQHTVGSGHQLHLCSLVLCAGDGILRPYKIAPARPGEPAGAHVLLYAFPPLIGPGRQ